MAVVDDPSPGARNGQAVTYEKQQQNTLDETVKRNAGNTTYGAPAVSGHSGISDLSTYGTGTTPRQNPKNPSVYMGADSRIAFVPMDKAMGLYHGWDAKTKGKFLSQLGLAGYDLGQLKDAQLADLWAGYVQGAAKYALAGNRVSPWDIIGMDIAQREEAAAKPKTVTQTSTQYNLSTAEDAHALFQGAAQTLLGRDPTKSEISRFKSILNKYEKANPATTTTTSNYLGSDLQSQTSKTTGGASAASEQLIAQEEAKKNPEYGAYQAATSGMNWLMEMVNGG